MGEALGRLCMGLSVVLLVIMATAAGWAVGAGEGGGVTTILAFGDSLTAGYGLPRGKAYPELLEARLRAEGKRVRVVNAGVSGDTTAGGLARLEWSLAQVPDVAIVALGANDGLRGLDVAAMEANLDKILATLQGRGVKLVLAGMRVPGNWGQAYADRFAAVFERLAKKYRAVYYPFLLAGVALDPALNLPDGIHPNEAGARRIADGLYPLVAPLVP